MHKRSILFRTVAVALAFSVQSIAVPLFATENPAVLAGAIVSADGQTPIADARLHVADPTSGKIYSSSPTAADGTFSVKGLPPATYELAVESGEILYLVGTPLQLAPGQSRAVNLEVSEDPADDPETAVEEEKKRKSGGTIWNNAGAAAGIVIAGAVVVGIGVDALTDDDPGPASAYFPGD